MDTIKNFFRQHKSIYLALYVPIYLAMYFSVEKLVPTTGYWVTDLPWDSAIPFCEYFVVFYCCWFLLLIGVGLTLLFLDERNFRLYMYNIIIGFTVSLLICCLFPNGQDLRPAVFERQNFFTWVVGLLYSADTNTNVLPSMHVVGAMAACFGVFHSKALSQKWLRIGIVVLTVLINLSTVFIKQHALLDVLAGLLLSAILYLVVYVIIERRMKPSIPVPSEEKEPIGMAAK